MAELVGRQGKGSKRFGAGPCVGLKLVAEIAEEGDWLAEQPSSQILERRGVFEDGFVGDRVAEPPQRLDGLTFAKLNPLTLLLEGLV